jgi:anti-sigma B factor antagonist
MHCTFSVAQYDELPIIYAHGDLDMATCPELSSLATSLIDQGESRVIVDLLDVAHTEAGVADALIGLHRKIESRGGKLAIVGCDLEVERLIRSAQVDRGPAVFGDDDSAAAYLSGLPAAD